MSEELQDQASVKVTTVEVVLGKLFDQITRTENLVFGDLPGNLKEQVSTPQPAGKAMRYISIIKEMSQRLQEINRQLESL